MKKICDAVFMGGGVRGIGYAGAVKAFHIAGYEFKNVAGSSVGAIIASLIAAGYTSEEIEREMFDLNYKKFKGKDFHFGLIGGLISFRKDYGVYNSDFFEKWLAELLARKGVVTFKDLEYKDNGVIKTRLTVTATDIFRKKLLILPQDFTEYGLDPREFEVAKAVRMSMSIPIFYHPYKLIDSDGIEHWIVDGGILCNYPMFLFDNGKDKLKRPLIGFKFEGCTQKSQMQHEKEKSAEEQKEGFGEYLARIADILFCSQDLQYSSIVRGESLRIVKIPVTVDGKDISPIDFGICKKASTALFDYGYAAATQFLQNWNFEKWLSKYRTCLCE